MGKSMNFMEPASLDDARRAKGKVVSPCDARIDASKMPEATNKENRGDDRLQFPSQIQPGVSKCEHDFKACDTSACSVHKCGSNIGMEEGFGFSVSELGSMHVKSSVTADIHPSKASQHGSWCHDDIFKKEAWKSPNGRNHGHKLSIDVVSNSDNHLISSGQPRSYHCSSKVGFLSSYANSSKENPSFEFFVVSEEGVNLYVDLNSIPSEWITSLKDEVCIDQRMQHQGLGSFSNPPRCFPDAGQHTKASPYENSELNLQNNGLETNTGCTNSSLCSVVSENCQSEVYPLDATFASSGSFVITASDNQAETFGHLESTKGLSSPCMDSSNFGNSKIVDDIFSSHEQTLKHQDSTGASFRTVQSSPSVPDGSVKPNADEIPSADVTTTNVETTECHSPNFQKADDNVDLIIENNSDLSVCEKNNLMELDEILDNSKITGNDIVENQVTVENTKLERDSQCSNIESSCHDGNPSDNDQLGDQLGNSLPEVPSSRYENSRKSNPLKRKSKCLHFQNASDKKASRRSRRSKLFNEENQNKRNDSLPPNTKSSVKEGNVNDLALLRRRSSRLLSKGKSVPLRIHKLDHRSMQISSFKGPGSSQGSRIVALLRPEPEAAIVAICSLCERTNLQHLGSI